MSFWKRPQKMGWAAMILGASILISRFMGLIRDKIISYLFGATQESDVYFAAFVIPDFINYLLAGAYFSVTLIPLLATFFEEDEEDGWRFFSAACTWVAVAIVALTAVAMAMAPQLARLAAPGLSPEALVRLARFLRIILPAQVCFLLGSCITALLYLRKQFVVPALTPLIYNGMIILGGVVLHRQGMEGFCWGVLGGAFFGNLLLPYLAARQTGGIRLRPVFSHPGLKRFVLLALPLMIGQSIVVLDEQLVRVFGSLAGVGAISWLNYARRIMLVPVGVVGQAAGAASFPFLAELVAKKDWSRFHETLRTALGNTLFLLIPLSVWMIAVSEPTILLVFQQGRFDPADTLATSRLLMIYLAVVGCWGFQQILGRAFYARQDTLTPAVIGTVATVLSVPVFWALTRSFGAAGVALGSVCGITLYTAALGLWWQRRSGGDAFRTLGAVSVKAAVMALAAAAPAFALSRLILETWRATHPYWGSLGSILASAALFGVIFAVLARRFTPDLAEPFLAKLGWRRQSAGDPDD